MRDLRGVGLAERSNVAMLGCHQWRLCRGHDLLFVSAPATASAAARKRNQDRPRQHHATQASSHRYAKRNRTPRPIPPDTATDEPGREKPSTRQARQRNRDENTVPRLPSSTYRLAETYRLVADTGRPRRCCFRCPSGQTRMSSSSAPRDRRDRSCVIEAALVCRGRSAASWGESRAAVTPVQNPTAGAAALAGLAERIASRPVAPTCSAPVVNSTGAGSETAQRAGAGRPSESYLRSTVSAACL